MTAPPREFVIATAGHVDHGKSVLVQALTGTDPDRLPEEKRRGMTIDLGFAQMTLPMPDGSTARIGLVDVPGHEDLVRNMVSGVGSVDAAMLVIAADDGPMPQTVEHLQILTYLGVPHGVVAMSKSDLITDIAAAIEHVRSFLAGTALATAPVVPVSVKTGAGLHELRTALSTVLSAAPIPADIDKPRLAVDRAFTVRGSGTVVTGTLTQGSLSRGQAVSIQPAGVVSRVRGLQSHGVPVEQAMPGARVAINLTDVAPAGEKVSGPSVGRGQWITSTMAARPTFIVDASIAVLAADQLKTTHRLRDGLTVKLHLGTAAVQARLQWDGEAHRFVRLRLDEAVYAMVGDRFVLRSASDQQTLAGGVVLDAMNKVRRRLSFLRDAAQHTLLAQRASDPLDAEITIRSAMDRDQIVDRGPLMGMLSHSHAELDRLIDQLANQGLLRPIGSCLVSADLWHRGLGGVEQAVTAYHQSHPQQQGLPLTDARRIVQSTFGAARHTSRLHAVSESIIAALADRQILRTGTVLRHTDHHPALPPRLQAAGQAILKALRERPFDPPSSKDLCRSDAALQAMKYLIATGQVVDVGQHTVLSADAYAAAIEQVRHQLRATGSATVSELKAALGSSRRVMVPLLERLDRDHVTRRQGDLRVLA